MVASICITTYNRPELLKRALKSALNQTYPKDLYEIIVVDDCSDLPGFDIPEKEQDIPNGVKYIRHNWNKGLSAARNTGIKAAKGEYIVCLDDDNELLPNFLEASIHFLMDKTNPNLGSSVKNIQAVAVGRIIQFKHFARTVVPGVSKVSSIDWGWLIRKKVFDEIQYDEKMRANEDTDFGIQFFKKFKAVQLDRSLTIAYDSESDKDSLSFPTERELQGMTYFFKKNFYEYTDAKEKWCLYRLMGRKFYRGGYRLKGLGYFLKGFWEYKTLRSFTHLFFLLFGWTIYDLFMAVEEKIASKL